MNEDVWLPEIIEDPDLDPDTFWVVDPVTGIPLGIGIVTDRREDPAQEQQT